MAQADDGLLYEIHALFRQGCSVSPAPALQISQVDLVRSRDRITIMRHMPNQVVGFDVLYEAASVISRYWDILALKCWVDHKQTHERTRGVNATRGDFQVTQCVCTSSPSNAALAGWLQPTIPGSPQIKAENSRSKGLF